MIEDYFLSVFIRKISLYISFILIIHAIKTMGKCPTLFSSLKIFSKIVIYFFINVWKIYCEKPLGPVVFFVGRFWKMNSIFFLYFSLVLFFNLDDLQLYKAVLVSAIQQRELALSIYMSSPS